MDVLKSEEKRMENVCGSDRLYKWWKRTSSNATKNSDHHRHFNWLQNSYFKEHMWKDATVLQKAYLFKSMLMRCAQEGIFLKALQFKLSKTFNASIFVSSFLNFVQIGVLHFIFATMVYVQGAKWKKLLTDWNEYQAFF